MKKRLEADLISIAHRVLKIKNKSEVDQLYIETRKLYEAITVLKFYGDNFEHIKNEIAETDLNTKLAAFVDQEVHETIIETPIVEEKVVAVADEPIVVEAKEEVEPIDSNEDKKIETITETITEIPEEILIEEKIELVEENTSENVVEEVIADVKEEILIEEKIELVEENKSENVVEEVIAEVKEEIVADENEIQKGISSEKEALAELLKKLSTKDEIIPEPDFEMTFDSKINENDVIEKVEKPTQTIFDDFLGGEYQEPIFVKPEELAKEVKIKAETTSKIAEFESKPKSLNDKISKGITIGLNDRVAFMKHLFDDNSEDYNRVLSQLITLDSLTEVQDFIDNFVKPDYNNWDGKEEYAERFMEIIEKKFV